MKIWVTRDEPPDGSLGAALRATGLEVVHEPVIARNTLTDARQEIARLGPDDWLVLTSVYAIESVAGDVARVPQIAVVSESSRSAAEARGFHVALVSKGGTAKSLFSELSLAAHGATVCYPRSSQAELQEVGPGITFVSPVLYETIARPYRKSVVDEIDIVTVTSASAVRAIGILTLPFASIGPSTTSALSEIGIEPWVESPQPRFDSLAQAIAAQVNVSRHHRA